VDVRKTARAFIAGAFEGLRKEFVIPTPIFHPYVRSSRSSKALSRNTAYACCVEMKSSPHRIPAPHHLTVADHYTEPANRPPILRTRTTR
jgi:hypothetical protein